MGLIFGTAGIPHSVSKRSSEEGIKRLKELGLRNMEVEFVQRVTMKEDTARRVGEYAKEEGIVLTVHAPYYINFNSREEEKVEASRKRLLLAARRGFHLGARGVVFHPGFRHDDPDDVVFENVLKNIKMVKDELSEEGVDIILRPETTGGHSQFGDLEEILRICKELDGVEPCIDFSHLHARRGGLNSYEEFTEMLDMAKDILGPDALSNMHIHLSGIEYGDKGERRHLILQESDMLYEELLRALKNYDASGLVVCESPNLEEDALLLSKTYERI